MSNTEHKSYVDKRTSTLVERIIVAKNIGISDENIASENDRINHPITLDDLRILNDTPNMRYHYKHAIAKVSWKWASEMHCDIAAIDEDDNITIDIVNNILAVMPIKLKLI
jgi:hypothetical protein